MGISPISRCKNSPYAVNGSAPDPKNFVIEDEIQQGAYLILIVRYPGCSNFEGRKVLLYKGFASSDDLLTRSGGALDPHFADDAAAPIARFAPSDLGMSALAQYLKSCQ